jgi:hypothetical protein
MMSYGTRAKSQDSVPIALVSIQVQALMSIGPMSSIPFHRAKSVPFWPLARKLRKVYKHHGKRLAGPSKRMRSAIQ